MSLKSKKRLHLKEQMIWVRARWKLGLPPKRALFHDKQIEDIKLSHT
jgi:hypothetical protein